MVDLTLNFPGGKGAVKKFKTLGGEGYDCGNFAFPCGISTTHITRKNISTHLGDGY